MSTSTEKSPSKVVIIGGGVAGLTAAHELRERGFHVVVYEKNEEGGKARSLKSDVDEKPAEHGFRFFPPFYHHLDDTLSRIPTTGGYVIDHLICLKKAALASQGRPFFYIPSYTPTSVREWVRTFASILGNPDLGLKGPEAAFAAYKLADAMTMCQARREKELDCRSWWDYMRADNFSERYRTVVVQGLTQNFVAMDAKESSTKSVINILARLFNDWMQPGGGLDRILDGPTSEVWIDPWKAYLAEERPEKWKKGQPYARGDRVSEPKKNQTPTTDTNETPTTDCETDIWQCCAAHVSDEETFEDAILDSSRWMKIGPKVEFKREEVSALLLNEKDSKIKGIETKAGTTDEGDFYIAAVPLEGMQAILINSNPAIINHAPSLKILMSRILKTNWMSGIMYYLHQDETMNVGHVVYLDSAWALTSISQNQFWKKKINSYGNDTSIMGCVSVIISDFFRKSPRTGKTAQESDNATKLKVETLEQVKSHLRGDVKANLQNPNIAGSYVDPALRFVFENKTIYDPQLFLGLMPAITFTRRKMKAIKLSHIDKNIEPLFINTVNSWSCRPKARTEISNLFLASDYVKTETDLATMEGANEAARLAVNGLLEVHKENRSVESTTPCRLFEFDEPVVFAPARAFDKWLFDRNLPRRPFSRKGGVRERMTELIDEGTLQEIYRRIGDRLG